MKYTLLEMVQTILSSMDSDEVSSINDTVESQQVAKVIRTAYFDLINRAQAPEHFDLKKLVQTTTATPVLMTVPDDVSQVEWIKYDSATATQTTVNMRMLDYLCLEDFFEMQDRLDPTNSWVGSMTVGESSFLFSKNAAPHFYTTMDDRQIIFDSYDSGVETQLKAAKTRAYCRLIIPFSLENAFTPDLDETQFIILLNEAKSLAWTELKQSPHVKAEQGAKRAWSLLQKSKDRIVGLSDFQKLPSYGRRYGRYY